MQENLFVYKTDNISIEWLSPLDKEFIDWHERLHARFVNQNKKQKRVRRERRFIRSLILEYKFKLIQLRK